MPKFAKPWFRKDRGWYVTLDGKQVPLGADRKSAVAEYHKLMQQPREAPKVRGDSVAVIVDHFLDWAQKNRAPDTYGWYRQRLEAFCQRYPDLTVAALRPFHVQEWIDSYDRSSGTRRNYARSIQRAIRWAKQMGYIDQNPIADFKKPKGGTRTTVNRLSPDTASRAFAETIPTGKKPLQILTSTDAVRSIHGVAYTRLWDADLVMTIREFATDFHPPQPTPRGATGLYSGEQDLFCFVIDPTGWAEIEGEAFAPGFFVWNSEVGKRSIGMSTFWFQAVCQNHIVWDAVEVTEFSRKHTASVHESLSDIRRTIEALVQKRDARKDGFVALMRKAMATKLGDDAPDVEKALAQNGISRQFAKEALKIAQQQGRFTIWALVDALTRLSGKLEFAGDRTDADQKAAGLLALAA